MGSWSGETKYRAILAVAAAANAHLDLSALLDAVAIALEDLVPIDVVGTIARRFDQPHLVAGTMRSSPRGSNEAESDYLARVGDRGLLQLVRREMSQALEFFEREPKPVVVDDVRSETRIPLEGAARLGVEAMALLPVIARGTTIAVLAFSRTRPRRFEDDEVEILRDISRPIGTAVANALAYEEIHRLRALLEEENVALKEEIAESSAVGGIIGSSPGLRAVLDRVARIAGTDATVLITGETGTGKELVARAIHASSPRAKRALIKVNCAVLPEGLVASELFGHERGAFTGAVDRRRGRFELAAGGTIFLDEIGELPQATQVALLRVLQEGEFERVGGSETLQTDARVVAATNRNLEEAVREGKFRADLFFRLNVLPIAVPPLRERAADIPIIAEYYANHYARKLGKLVRGISPSAMEMLASYAWPGNVRELQNLVERAVTLSRGNVLNVADFELPSLKPPSGEAPDSSERQRIEAALRSSRGRVSGPDGAARALGIPPSTLESRLQRLGIDKHAFRRRGGD